MYLSISSLNCLYHHSPLALAAWSLLIVWKSHIKALQILYIYIQNKYFQVFKIHLKNVEFSRVVIDQ